MKNILLLLITANVLLSSCKKDTGVSPEPGGSDSSGEVTPVGLPDGSAAAVKTIGVQGGVLASSDGLLKLTIPQGALNSDQEISIQSVSNNSPLGLNQAYRITPHDLQFNKPVTIQFSYNDEDITHTLPELLGIAYQDGNGIWQARGGRSIDKVNKTVSVTSTHFSDWALFSSILLSASGTVAPVNSSIQLEVYAVGDLVIPSSSAQDAPMGKAESIAAPYVKEWKLIGAGTLTAAGVSATYKAPSAVPAAPNPVTVSVRLDPKDGGLYLLLAHIEVADDNGEIEIRVAGNDWVKKTVSPAVELGDNYYGFGDSDGDTQGSYVLITWVGGQGTHAYKSPQEAEGTHAHYLVTNSNDYVCFYRNEENEFVASGGGVTITSMGDDDGFIKGTFTIEPAGYGLNLQNKINIEGRFRVRKGWS